MVMILKSMKNIRCWSLSVTTILTLLSGSYGETKGNDPLLCYIGGTMRPAVEKLAEMYKKKTGIKIYPDYSSSGEALIKVKQTGRGDLIVVHDPYIGQILKEKIGDTAFTVATMRGVIIVPKGNPKNIRGINDLAKPGIKLIFSDQQYSTLGHVVDVINKKSGLGSKIEGNIISRTKGSAEAANAICVGTGDAAIVWDAVAWLRKDKVDVIEIDPRYQPQAGIDAISSSTFGNIDMSSVRVTVARLKCSKHQDEALKFAEFMVSEEGAKVWKEMGYSPIPKSDQIISKNSKSILVYCAAGMRKPISKLAQLFQDSTGIKVEMTYDGSNRLLGQIELSKRGDLYIAGDADYIQMAKFKGLVDKCDTLCWFVPVLMIQKNNPKKIIGFTSLLKPGIRIGQGDEKSAAVGRITPIILKKNAVNLDSWKQNVVLSTPTINELGNAIKLGTVDAVIVWNATALDYKDVAEIIPIEKSKNVIPAVEATVLTTTNDKSTANAFLSFLASPRGISVMTESGYCVDKP
jgi:molybdate transport system substrate-binding protein